MSIINNEDEDLQPFNHVLFPDHPVIDPTKPPTWNRVPVQLNEHPRVPTDISHSTASISTQPTVLAARQRNARFNQVRVRRITPLQIL